jgi:ribosomal protein S25
VTLDGETEERIEQPIPAEAERETRMTPSEAVDRMRINVPSRGNRKLRTLIDRVNADRQLKGWWHVANVNAVARMEINDHSWVHVQIVTNIALKLLRQLTKHGVEPALVRDYGTSMGCSSVSSRKRSRRGREPAHRPLGKGSGTPGGFPGEPLPSQNRHSFISISWGF